MDPRILLIDDDPLTREMVEALLATEGYRVDTAADGFAGLELLRSRVYGLVLVDYHLPEMDGYAFARIISRNSLSASAQHPPLLVAMTADQHGLAARRGVDVIFDAVLAKPIEAATLGARLRSLLASRSEDGGTAEAFLADPRPQRARIFANTLWRRYGLAGRPKLALWPEPSLEQAELLHPFFERTQADSAVALGRLDSGSEAVPDLGGDAVLLPVIGFLEDARERCDEIFKVSDPESWDRVARLILLTTERRRQLQPIQSEMALTTRLLRFLYVWDRVLLLEAGPPLNALGGRFRVSVSDLGDAAMALADEGYLTSFQALGTGERRIFAVSDQGAASVVRSEPRRAMDQEDEAVTGLDVQGRQRALLRAFGPGQAAAD